MPRPNGPQFRKVGDHKMYRHGPGNWETVDNYHFNQGSGGGNLWNVHDLRDDTTSYPVFETGSGNLRSAHAEFRQSYPERDSGENPLYGTS